VLARHKHPGQKNNLDALCKRYGIDNGHRQLHGALLDAEILADVYLLMTGGQTALLLGQGNSDESSEGGDSGEVQPVRLNGGSLSVVRATAAELESHQAYLDMLEKKSDGGCIWLRGETVAEG
jgi:DNA polymerase-3 subunit epsilon